MPRCVLFVLVVLLTATTSFAEIMTFEKEVEEIVANDQSREQVEAFALQKVKRLAVEEAGTYISSRTVVSNYRLMKDEITALASGIVQTKIVGETKLRLENGVVHVNVKARIQVDTTILDKQVAELLKEKGILKKLEGEQEKVRELENQLANLKSTELKRLEELNAQAISMEQERDRRRLANAEMALNAQGELKKVEIERLQKEREIQQQTAKMLSDQEHQRKAEVETLAREQDRIRRAQLENEQRWNDLARKSQLAQQQWVAIDDSLSLKQALDEARAIKEEIANLKQRSKFQYEESLRTFKAAYVQQISATTVKLPPPLAKRDLFESTAEYNARKSTYDEQVGVANKENARGIQKLKDEEALKLAEAKVESLKQQVRVLEPFIRRIQALQAKRFALPNEPVSVALGTPDADRSCFPTSITHKKDSWTVDWQYTDRNTARDIYSTRAFLKAEAMVQLDDTSPAGYVMTVARITHPGTGLQENLEVARPQEFAEITAFDRSSNRELAASQKENNLSRYLLNRNACIAGADIARNSLVVCGQVILDTRTGLEWARDANIAGQLSWDQVNEWIATLNYAGIQGWRVPTCEEIKAMFGGEYNQEKYEQSVGDLRKNRDRQYQYLQSVGFINVQHEKSKNNPSKYWAINRNGPDVVYYDGSGCRGGGGRAQRNGAFVIPVRTGEENTLQENNLAKPQEEMGKKKAHKTKKAKKAE